MATRSKPNWKVLDRLLTVLEKEGWTHAQMAEDWGISVATLEGHLSQEVSTVKRREIDWQHFDELKALGLSMPRISQEMAIPQRTLEDRVRHRKKEEQTIVQRPVHTMSTGAEQSTDTDADEWFGEPNGQSVQVHVPVQTSVHTSDTGVDDSAESSVDNGPVLSQLPAPVQTAVQRFDTGPVQTLDTGAVQRLDRLEEEVQTLAHAVRSLADRLNHTPVQSTVQITTLPPYPKGKSIRWNFWILDSIRDELATLAAARDISPSQLVQELLWTSLRQRHQEVNS